MYTHTYTQYVNHILNKSPSKTTYTFPKAERFSPSKPQPLVSQPFLQANGFQYRDGAKKYAYFINQEPQTNETKYNQLKERRQYYEQPKRIIEDDSRKNAILKRSRSKSPFQPYSRHLPVRQNARFIDNKQEYKMQNFGINYPSYYPKPTHLPSSKTPKKSNKKPTISPNKTLTKQLYDIDHVSKNMTINGYYPTGCQLSPDGKYPISKIKNSPTYKFGNSPPKQRYNYIVKSEDSLGPGYYEQFSEFGPIKK